MAITGYSSFVGTLAGLTVTGVTRSYAYPPQQVNDTDCPILYVRIPSGTEGPMTLQTAGGWPNMTCEIVVLMRAYMLNTNAVNFVATTTMMDSLSTALRGSAPSLGPINWTIQHNIVDVDDAPFWAVIASVSGNG